MTPQQELIHSFGTLWPFWALVALVGLTKALFWALYYRRLSRSGIAEIDVMDGTTFERRLSVLFRALGYDIRHTGRRGDYGADLVIEKDGVRTVVQAKRWTKTSA